MIYYLFFEGHLKVVNKLIEAGANLEAKDKDDYSPLHHAAIVSISQYLIIFI